MTSMLAKRAIFTGPGKLLGNVHYSLPSRIEPWPQPTSQQSAVDKLADDVASTPSTNNDTPPPQDIFNSWKLNSFYSPLDFLRSRRIRSSITAFRRTPPVGPGAKEALYKDAFRQLDIDPIREANNSNLLGSFITGMGKIRGRPLTGLSWRSQRKVTKAIKRAKQKGVMAISSNLYSMTNK